jgi:hypothetical protein
MTTVDVVDGDEDVDGADNGMKLMLSMSGGGMFLLMILRALRR